MKRVVFILLFCIAVAAQVQPVRVTSTEATAHLTKRYDPIYPPMAELGRIQGNVVLLVTIDERGKPSSVELMHGHPMLVQAAVDAVKKSSYKPFTANGTPVTVLAPVMVTFGRPARDKEERIELQAEDYIGAGEQAATKGDYVNAQAQFDLAKQTLISVAGGSEFVQWELWIAVAKMQEKQKKYQQAESTYKQAASVYANYPYPSSKAAETLAKLASLYLEQKRYSDASRSLTESTGILEVACRKVQCADSTRKENVRKLAHQYFELSRIASLQNNVAEIATWCKKALDNKKALDDSDRDAVVTSCGETIKAAGR